MNIGLEDLRRLEKEALTLPEERDITLRRLPYAREPYFRFFYRLVREFQPKKALELGTDKASCTAHLAANPGTLVTTVDCRPASVRNAKRLALPNVEAVHEGSLQYAKRIGALPEPPRFELLFIDTIHTPQQAWGEYEAFRPFLSPDAVVVFDDVGLNAEMEGIWNKIPGQKVRLDGLHYTGFGAVLT